VSVSAVFCASSDDKIKKHSHGGKKTCTHKNKRIIIFKMSLIKLLFSFLSKNMAVLLLSLLVSLILSTHFAEPTIDDQPFCLHLQQPVNNSIYTVYAEVPGEMLYKPVQVFVSFLVIQRTLNCHLNEGFDLILDGVETEETKLVGTIPRGLLAESPEVLFTEINLDFGSYVVTIRGNESMDVVQSARFVVEKKLAFTAPEHVLFTDNIRRMHYVTIGRGTYGVKEIWETVDESMYDISPWNITIGNFCSFSSNVSFLLFKSRIHDYSSVSTYPFAQWLTKGIKFKDDIPADRNVSIGNDVWIGHSAAFVNAVTVGDGAVVGAHAVVRENVPPYAIVFGNPAKVVKYRFPADVIEKLLTIRWWDWADERILASRFYEMPVEEFVNKYYQDA